MSRPKLILLNGPAGVGKTTIAKKYADEHPLTLHLSGDDIIAMLGDWIHHEDEARDITLELAEKMAEQHLRNGHDVIVPYLITKPEHAAFFQTIAKRNNAAFFEIVLLTEKEAAIERLMERGTWGEPDAPKITEKDLPIIEGLYDKMHRALQARPNAIQVVSMKDDIAGTYRAFLKSLSLQK